MADTLTLDNLVLQVRQRADIENSQHITDAEIIRYVNTSAKTLHRMMAEQSPETFAITCSFTTQVGRETYTIPTSSAYPSSSFYKLVHATAQVQGFWRSLERYTPETETWYRNAGTWGVASLPCAYNITRGDSISFAPVPDGTYPIRLSYITNFASMVSGSDLYDGRDGFEEWVILDACIKCTQKDETNADNFKAERDRIERDLRVQFTNEDLDHPPRVRMTAGSYEGLWPWVGVR